jgi:hypothetical protein
MKKNNGIPEVSDKWQAEQDLQTLLDADDIREDDKRMTAVRKLAKDKLADMAKISAMATEKPSPGETD